MKFYFTIFFFFNLIVFSLFSGLQSDDHQVKFKDLEKLLLLKSSGEGLVKLEDLAPWLQDKRLKSEVQEWLAVKQAEVDGTKEEHHPLLIDDIHRKLLKYLKGYGAERKWVEFKLDIRIAHDSNVAKTREGEVFPSGDSSVRRDALIEADFEGRWLPWGKANLGLGFDDRSYERSSVEAFGYSSFNLDYGHEFKFFKPSFFKKSKFGVDIDYAISDSGDSHPAYFTSVRPSFKLFDDDDNDTLKPDSMKFELEFRNYASSFDEGLDGDSRDVTGIRLEYLWEHSFVYDLVTFNQNFIVFIRNYDSDSEELDYSTLAFSYKNDFVLNKIELSPRASIEKNLSQEYNSIDRDDIVLRLGVNVARNIYKKDAKIILAFEWEDRQSDHTSFDYNNETFYLGFQCHW